MIILNLMPSPYGKQRAGFYEHLYYNDEYIEIHTILHVKLGCPHCDGSPHGAF